MTNTLTLADTITNLTTLEGGTSINTELTPGEEGSSVALHVSGRDTGLTAVLAPLEAVELATTLLMYARAAAWGGEVL